MKIPVYRTQAQATSEAPGASIRARMDAGTFVRAELAKGEAVSAALGAVNKYALTRMEAEAKIQYNEAMLAAEVEMRNLADKYKDSARLGDVINEKGTGGWQLETKDMRARLGDSMSSRSMTDAFNARFDQQEVAIRFQLRDSIESRIKARAAAASAARQESLVAQMSDHRASLELLPFLLAGNDAEMASDVKAGLISPEMRTMVNQKMIGDIAKGAAASLVGSDPTMAIRLAKALQLQDMVDAGQISSEDAAAASGLGSESQYTLAVLQLAPRDVALAALGDAITMANKFDAVSDEIKTENEAASAKIIVDAYNSIFGVDPNAPASLELTARLTPQALALIGKGPDELITGREYIDASTAFLDRTNNLSPAQRREIETHRNPDTTGPFAKTSDSGVFATLNVRALSGSLTIDALNGSKTSLSSTDYNALAAKVFTEADQSFNLVDDRLASAFKYNKLAGANDELSKAAEVAYASASAELQAEYNKRRAAGTPMSSIELNARATALINENRLQFKETIQQNLSDYITALGARGLPPLAKGRELEDLDAWYNSLPDQKSKLSTYTGARAEINRRLQMMQDQ